jgi:8-oxo-dGTP diphosphatase
MKRVLPAMKALIMDSGKFLIIKQEKDGLEYWDLPGGLVNFGEYPVDTLHREVKEEVGMDVTIKKPLGVWWFFFQNGDNHVICFTYLCRPKNNKVRLDGNPDEEERILEAKWVSREDVLRDDFPVPHESFRHLVSGI